jgi:hypothetical protein
MQLTRWIIFLFLFTFHMQLFAGAWTQEKGKGFEQLSFTYLRYSGLINGSDPSSKLKREVTDFTLQNYLEYGLTDRLTLISVVPFKLLETGQEVLNIDPEDDLYPGDTLEAGSLNGFSNVTLAMKYALKKGRVVWSAQLRVGTGNSRYDHATGLRTAYNSWLFTPSLLFGKGWNKSYLSTEAGFQYKTNNYAHNFIANVELGKRIDWKKTKTWLAFVFDALIPVTTGSFDDGNSIHTGMFQNGEGYVSPGIKVSHYMTQHFIFNFATYGAVWADHGGASPTLNFGLAYEW